MNQIQESVLFRTSAGTDVQCSGGKLTVAGLSSTYKSRLLQIQQIKYRTEVVQVITIGATAYNPTGATQYTIEIGDVTRRRNGAVEQLARYTFTTPPDITTLGLTPALQRETISLGLVALINAKSPSNFVVAASLGTGTGLTITDTAGYYPVFTQTGRNRNGASTVLPCANPDDTGFLATNVVTTTAAVYAFGIGADLLASIPVVDALYGGLLSGYLLGMLNGLAPKTADNLSAVSGQNYDGFIILSLTDAPAHNQRGQLAFVPKMQAIFVDNGSGNSTANLAGFLTFEREMRKVMVQTYATDQSAVIQWMDQNFLEQGPLGAVPVTTTAIVNKFITPYGMLNHVNIGTQTIVTATQGANGLLIEQDATATEGAAYTPDLSTVNSQQFVVGKTAITVNCKASFTTPANIVFMVGLRSKEAHAAGFNTYAKLATIGTGAAGTFFATYGSLATTTSVTTTSAISALTTVQYDFRIQVAFDGTVSAYANNVKFPIYSVGTTPLVFAAGTILVLHMQYTNLNSAAAVPNVSELWAVGSDVVIS